MGGRFHTTSRRSAGSLLGGSRSRCRSAGSRTSSGRSTGALVLRYVLLAATSTAFYVASAVLRRRQCPQRRSFCWRSTPTTSAWCSGLHVVHRAAVRDRGRRAVVHGVDARTCLRLLRGERALYGVAVFANAFSVFFAARCCSSRASSRFAAGFARWAGSSSVAPRRPSGRRGVHRGLPLLPRVPRRHRAEDLVKPTSTSLGRTTNSHRPSSARRASSSTASRGSMHPSCSQRGW